MVNIHRRRALILLASVGGFASLPLPVRAVFAADLPAPLARFHESLDVQAAAQLGSAYLKLHADEADSRRLLDLILEGTEGSTDLAGQLSSKVRADFASDRVVTLNDWQISETEARIFAAVALSV